MSLPLIGLDNEGNPSEEPPVEALKAAPAAEASTAEVPVDGTPAPRQSLFQARRRKPPRNPGLKSCARWAQPLHCAVCWAVFWLWCCCTLG